MKGRTNGDFETEQSLAPTTPRQQHVQHMIISPFEKWSSVRGPRDNRLLFGLSYALLFYCIFCGTLFLGQVHILHITPHNTTICHFYAFKGHYNYLILVFARKKVLKIGNVTATLCHIRTVMQDGSITLTLQDIE